MKEWISVNDRLPEEEGNYQVCNRIVDPPIIEDGFYQIFKRGFWFIDGKDETKFITHWMPLPNPPSL